MSAHRIKCSRDTIKFVTVFWVTLSCCQSPAEVSLLKVLQLPLMHLALAFEGNTGLPSFQSPHPKHRPHEPVVTLLGLPLPGCRAAKEVGQSLLTDCPTVCNHCKTIWPGRTTDADHSVPGNTCMTYLPCYPVKVQSQQQGSATKSGRGKSCLTASVTCSDDDYIVVLFIVPLMCLQSQCER